MSNPDFLNLTVTSSNNVINSVERRFRRDLIIEEFKNKLELLTGCNPKTVKLEVYTKNDDLVCELINNNTTLGSYPINDGMRLHVIDNANPIFSDTSAVQKFEMPAEIYDQKSDTVRSFLKENKLGKYNEETVRQIQENKLLELENEKRLISTMKVNDRCEVSVPGNPKRLATIMYLGETKFKSGYWVGVKYDEPLGKNNGSVAGVKYFECFDKYGGFVKPGNVVVGDFPEQDELNEL